MTSRYQVFGLRFALGAALLASACQRDSKAEFDDRNLASPDEGGSAAGGSFNAAAGENPGGGSDAGGSDALAGAPAQGGKSSAGAAGIGPTAGKGGSASAGGKAGGGGASQGGKANQGGMAGASGGGGTAGSTSPTDPITLDTADIDDTYVASCMSQLNFGEAKQVNVDGNGSCRYDALIDVPRLELPDGALVSEAILTLVCTNAGAAITVSYANEAWKELLVRWNTRPEVGATIGQITCAEVGPVTLDLTSAFKAWLSGEHAAHGIYLRTEETDGTDFGSSEADKTSSRPKLSITYTMP